MFFVFANVFQHVFQDVHPNVFGGLRDLAGDKSGASLRHPLMSPYEPYKALKEPLNCLMRP